MIRYQAIAIMLCSVSGLAMNVSAGRLLTDIVIDAAACLGVLHSRAGPAVADSRG